ncbi:RNA polymerase sigma factor [Singulisphaera rosea]
MDDSATSVGGGVDARASQEAFVVASYGGLYRWFFRVTASPEVSADLTQATFAAFWTSAGQRKPHVSETTWLYAIGRNLWRKWLRDRKAHSSEALDQVRADGRSPEERAEDREFDEAARRAVAALPPDLREVFTLRFWSEFSYEQIGDIQGVEAGLVRWRYFAARRRLHHALAAWDPDRARTQEDGHVRFHES